MFIYPERDSNLSRPRNYYLLSNPVGAKLGKELGKAFARFCKNAVTSVNSCSFCNSVGLVVKLISNRPNLEGGMYIKAL